MSSRPTAIPLRTQISLLVCGVVLVALAATGLAVTAQVEGRTREALVEKAAMAATLTAEARSVVEGLEGRAPAGDIQPYVARLVELTAVDYIVVLDMKGARLSHPNPSLLGARFVGGDDAPVYEGKAYTSLAKGTLGTAHRVFRPVRNAQGRQVGAVAAGVLVSGMGQTTRAVRRLILLGALLGFGIGAGGALLVAGRVKRIMLGMEPGDMAALLQQRNAVLQSVRAGIVATDAEQRITLVNQEATRLFRLVGQEGDLLGERVDRLLPQAGLEAVLAGGESQLDRPQDLLGLSVMTTTVPVQVMGRTVGCLIILRDMSEVNLLAEQLTGVRLYADALRAQTHEFMNKLHVILGLVRLGETERLTQFLAEITGRLNDEAGYVIQRIKDPVIAGFLMARFAAAREQGVILFLAEEAHLPPLSNRDLVHDLVTILGNLLENAVEAMATAPVKEIHLDVQAGEDWLEVRVEDTGPGIDPAVLDRLFEKGVSTRGADRGLGLHHVRLCAEGRGGQLEAHNQDDGGAVLAVRLKVPVEVTP